MSTLTEIARITSARDTLRNKGINLGIALPTDNLSQIATKFDGIINKGAIQIEVMEGQTVPIPAGYHNGSGSATGISGGGGYALQSKTVTPTKSTQNVTPDEGYFGLSSVTVNPIPAAYQDISSVTATPGDVLVTKTFVPSSGTLTTGTMPNNGTISGNIDGLSVMSYTIPVGYHNGAGTVSLSNDIELALAAI